MESYETADTKSKDCLAPTHPIRLGLILNYSVFYYEIKQNASKACKMARDAFDEAIADLDNEASQLTLEHEISPHSLWCKGSYADRVIEKLEGQIVDSYVKVCFTISSRGYHLVYLSNFCI